MSDNSSTQWTMELEYLQSCNCDYGCPCNFNALPTYGNCEALLGYHVLKGNFGDTNLDGVTFAWGLWWPKAIHLGDGIGALYVDSKASPEQVKSIEKIISGKYGGGVFAIFPATFKTTLPTKIAKIDFYYDPYDGWFTVEGAGEVRSQHITNPVTGAQWEGELMVPGGIAFKHGTVSSVNWDWNSEDISLKHEKKNGHASIVKFSNAGCIG
ncbi:MAG TPA: DUF1326 domain-containing protein [Chitinophagaceae bacterium]